MSRPPTSPSPPPAAFSFTSGNFDFPHASTSPPPPPPAAQDRSSFDQLQQLFERRDQERDARTNGAGESEDNVPPSRRLRAEAARHRALRRSATGAREPTESTNSSLRRPPAFASSRPRATPSGRYLRRSRANSREQRPTENLESLYEFPVPNPFTIMSSGTRPRSPTSEMDNPRRQTKRRKLEHEAGRAPPYDGFKYGYKGQVVPGRLKMEIMSCDGGEYKHSSSSELYTIRNVLKNDKSVYCSERSRCNLLLKHIGEMPFALDKVVIRAPDRGFTAPIQEGLIFVAMSSEDLLSGTSSYQIEYGSPSPRMSPVPSALGEQTLSLREALEDPQIWEESRQAMEEAAMQEQIERLRLRNRRVDNDSAARANRERRRQERRRMVYNDHDVFAENCDYPAEESHATAAGVSAPTPPPFTITTDSDEDGDDSEELPSAAIMADRLRRESRWRADSDEDEDDMLYRFPPPRRAYALDSSDDFAERRWRSDRYLEPIRATRLRAPSRIEVQSMQADTDSINPIAPHARFFIEKHKNKITIKFHPAVSGKFVLLKLWSPAHDGNIDIESVQFYGHSGPRYFPALQPR